MRSFRSDNNAGLVPEALEAITLANDGSHVTGYSDDAWTDRAVGQFRRVLGDDTAVFFVATGTAANTLAVASLTEPWESVMCHIFSHWHEHESTAPERITHCRTVQVQPPDGRSSKLTPELIDHHAGLIHGDVHQPQPGVVTISNPTEMGEVYAPDEVRAICDTAHRLGYRVHVDGARFANAVAALDCDPRDITVGAGVDALSFGGTKNGLAAGEAICLFPQGDGAHYRRAMHALPFHRKGTGHLLSKHRFISAPFAHILQTGAWLTHARHANAMAATLAAGLSEIAVTPSYPVQTNGVFAVFPDAMHRALQDAGQEYYPVGRPEWGLFRLMTSFDTSPDDIDQFLRVAQASTVSPAAPQRTDP
jgi:threonine aldolase